MWCALCSVCVVCWIYDLSFIAPAVLGCVRMRLSTSAAATALINSVVNWLFTSSMRFVPLFHRAPRRWRSLTVPLSFCVTFLRIGLMRAPAAQFRVEINIAVSLPHVIITIITQWNSFEYFFVLNFLSDRKMARNRFLCLIGKVLPSYGNRWEGSIQIK